MFIIDACRVIENPCDFELINMYCYNNLILVIILKLQNTTLGILNSITKPSAISVRKRYIDTHVQCKYGNICII